MIEEEDLIQYALRVAAESGENLTREQVIEHIHANSLGGINTDE